MSKNIAIVGAGGINSWFIQNMDEVLKLFDKKDINYVKIFDEDIVEEKNLKRGNQNFKVNDLLEPKAEVLGKRFAFDYEITFITAENIDKKLGNFDAIVLGVDNNKTRRMVYEYCLKNEKYLLDMRAQGTQMMFIVLNLKRKIDYYDKKYFSSKEMMERKGSCQLQKDIDDDHIENANKAIAFIGAYCVMLKYMRDEEIAMEEFKVAY